MTTEELTVLNNWTERYKADSWGIYINGVRVRARSGKSGWKTERQARAGLTNLIKYGGLCANIKYMRTGQYARQLSDVKALITELTEAGRIQILQDVPHGPSN